MAGDLTPEYVLNQLQEGRLFPFYLFYGESEFRLEKVLRRIREEFVGGGARDFNIHVFYGNKGEQGGTVGPGEIMDTVRSLPFMSPRRLVIIRRVEEFPPSTLEDFLPYFDDPVETSCLIFVSTKPDFRKRFYKHLKGLGRAVNFRKLYDNEVIPWIKRTAKELGLNIEHQACAQLQEIVGPRMRDLYSELEKLALCYGQKTIGVAEVKDSAIHSRIYTIFELMDAVSSKEAAEALLVLNKFLEEEGQDGPLRVLGMLNRQIQLLWKAKAVVDGGGKGDVVTKKLGLKPFQANKLTPQVKHWSLADLEEAFQVLYEADGRLKSGAQGRLILEEVMLTLCN